MSKVNPLQFQILDRLFFTEPFTNLLEEINEPVAFIADELKTLLMRGLVQSMEYDEKRGMWKKTLYYDSDNLEAFSYRITSDGMTALETYKNQS